MKNIDHIVIVGLGSQAKAWALNLRDSGRDVTIALRANSPSLALVKKMGLSYVLLNSKELKSYDTFALLIPDHGHEDFFKTNKEYINPNANIIYAHGYSYCAFNLKDKYTEFNHYLLAPKAIASEVRFQYETAGKLAAVYSEEGKLPHSRPFNLQALAKDLGINQGPYPATFLEETNADLFSEQSLLCSLLPYGALHSFNKLREKGIPKELAYLECWTEVKLIADTMIKKGPVEFFKLISPNALIGGEKAAKLLFDQNYMKKLDSLLSDIFTQKFFTEIAATDFNKLKIEVLKRWENEELNEVHKQISSDQMKGEMQGEI